MATVGAVRVENTSRYGTLKLDNKGRIIAFLEKPEREKDEARESGKQVINGGIYVFEKELLKRLSPRRVISLEREVFPSLLRGNNLYGYVEQSFFLDIGVPEDLERARHELPQLFQLGDSESRARCAAGITL